MDFEIDFEYEVLEDAHDDDILLKINCFFHFQKRPLKRFKKGISGQLYTHFC